MPNSQKWHLLLNVARNDLSVTIRNASCEKILGVYFDNTLNVNIHVTKLCKKAGQRLPCYFEKMQIYLLKLGQYNLGDLGF